MLQQNKQQYPFFENNHWKLFELPIEAKIRLLHQIWVSFFFGKKIQTLHQIRFGVCFRVARPAGCHLLLQGSLWWWVCFPCQLRSEQTLSCITYIYIIIYIYTYYIIEGVSRPYIMVYIIWSNWAFEVSMKCWVLVWISSIWKHLRRVSHEFFIRVFVRYFLLHHLSHEKRQALLSTESWLFNRDPYNGLQL